jgi:sulfotransferase family protein
MDAVAGDRVALIDTKRLVDSAQFASGNFGPVDHGLLARVEHVVGVLNERPPASDERRAIELQLRKLLANRLRIAADHRRIPQIADETIERPIFVIGFARTGTTLIHSLLVEDPDARAPLWWHTHDPSPPPGEVPVCDERIEFAAKDLDRFIHKVPGLLTLHPYWDKRGHCLIEDEEIFTLDFQNAYPSMLYDIPNLGMMLTAADPIEAYSFHKQFLQHLQWNCGPGHWVVKGVYHQFVLKALLEAYPDCLCIWPHRHPLEVWPSTLAITAVLYGAISNWSMDFAALGPSFVESIGEQLNRAIEDPLVDDPRIVHVDFAALVQDPITVIRTAYEQWGKPFGRTFEQRMEAWLGDPANRPDRYGRYSYALEPFGLTKPMIERSFAPYIDRFQLKAPQ